MTRDNPKTALGNDGLGRRCQSSAVPSHLQSPHLQRPIHTRRGPSRAVFGAPWGRKRAFEKSILNSDLRKIRVRLQFFPFKYHLDTRCRVARHLDTSAFLRSSNTGPSAVNLSRQHTQQFDTIYISGYQWTSLYHAHIHIPHRCSSASTLSDNMSLFLYHQRMYALLGCIYRINCHLCLHHQNYEYS